MLEVYDIKTRDNKEMLVKTENEAKQILMGKYPDGHWLYGEFVSKKGYWFGHYYITEIIPEDEKHMYQWLDYEDEDDD